MSNKPSQCTSLTGRHRPQGIIIVSVVALTTLVVAWDKRPARSLQSSRTTSTASLDAVIVGGGPSPHYNQFGIESNVRYVTSLIPPSGAKRVLFADGTSATRTVQYLSPSGRVRYRAPRLTEIDGPSTIGAFDTALRTVLGDPRYTIPSDNVGAASGRPLLLYFTGHGGPDENGDYQENDYGLWKDGSLTVSDLRTRLDRVPDGRSTVLVMVQCFSGAFADLAFKGKRRQAENAEAHASLPETRPLRENFCGFFASVAEREAAGCTPEVNEAEYHDFTSYFFAALSGHDRVGRPVSGADYNHDGHVGMNEAFAYTMIHDVSIDTPVCTSDAFLRNAVTTSNDDVFKTRYSDIRKWASPCQAAVLNQIGAKLQLSGDDAPAQAYRVMVRRLQSEDDDDDSGDGSRTALWVRFVRTVKTVVLEHQLEQSGDEPRKVQLTHLLAKEAEVLPLVGQK